MPYRIFFVLCFLTVRAKSVCFIDRCPLPDISSIRYSGFFGELRKGHFHSGVDIKTDNKTGLEIRAFEKGYVYRISITLSGYGKALYIKHPNGFISVYAHLERFSAPIESYVRAKQYEKEVYIINLYPKKRIYIKKNGIVGYSGNSGRSFAPHLHFELRDEKQNPVNPLLYGLNIEDHMPPELKSVYISFLNRDNPRKDLKLTFKPVGQNILKTPIQEISGRIGFKIQTFDRHDLSYNKNGTYKIETFLNDIKYVSIRSDQLRFQESKLINDHIDYEKFILQKKTFQKLYIDHVKINSFKYSKGDGSIYIQPGKKYNFRIVLSDISKNEKTLLIPILGKKMKYGEKKTTNCPEKNSFVVPSQGLIIQKEKFKITFPKNAFFQEKQPICVKGVKHKLFLTPSTIPLKKDIAISYTTKDPKELALLDKYIFIQKDNLDTTFLKTQFQNTHTIKTNTSKMGSHILMKDTSPPHMQLKNPNLGLQTLDTPTIQVLLTDQGSGVKEYRATINEQWILMEYDLKTSTLTYHHHGNRLKKDKKYELKIFAQDWAGNISEYHTLLRHFSLD